MASAPDETAVQAAMTPIKFGTDGWRGIIADDFTFDLTDFRQRFGDLGFS